jgi:hypothetical protein
VHPERVWNSLSLGIVSLRKGQQNDTARDSQLSKKHKNTETDGKKKGYQIKPNQHIDLKEVAEADNHNIRDRMLNLEKQFSKIPSNRLEKQGASEDEQCEQEDQIVSRNLNQ